jgi:two-component system sensor histidine kinase EvgS
MEYLLIILFCLFLVLVYKLNFYTHLYDNFTDGVSIISDSKIVDCNYALIELFGYTDKKEFLAVHPLQLTPAFQPDGSLSFDKAKKMMENVENDGKCKFDWVFLDINQNEKWIEIDIIKLKKKFFYKEKICMVWKDITLRIKIQNELKEFNQNLEIIIEKEIKKNIEKEKLLLMQSKLAQLGEMISMIAHQWRQPLSAISASVIDLQMKLILNRKDKNLLEYVDTKLTDIETITESLTNTIDDFKDFYKPDKIKKKANINLVIDKAYGIIKNYFATNNIKVIFNYQSDQELNLFENELIQVFLNILQNSKENFISKGIKNPKILISTTNINNTISINICDNGGGCNNTILEKIFEPYFSTKHEKNGTGIGLYMSLKIIQEHHNGTITAVNTNDGICFSIIIKS